MKNRIIIIGIDGCDWKLLNELMKEDKIPNIKKIIDRGSSGILKSSILPSSEQAWSSFSSGCNNGKHGIFSYIQRKDNGYSFDLVDGSFFKGKRFWDILGAYGKKSIIINVTATYPPRKINGILVSCRLTPPNVSQYTYPRYIKREIENIASGYIKRIPRLKFSKNNPRKVRSYLKRIDKKIKERGKVARYLMAKYDWDLSVVVFDYSDDLQHIFWEDFFKKTRYAYVLPEIYERIDKEIGQILSQVQGDCNVIIMSDHGFAPLKRRINFNALLKNRGYFVQKKGSLSGFKKDLIKNIRRFVPSPLEEYIKKYFFNSLISSLAYSDVEWNRTKAFSVGSGGIQINLKGREEEGCVEKKDYEKLREEIINILKDLRDPKTQKRAIKRVFKREEIYSGDFVKDAPDIINLLEDGYKPELFSAKKDIFYDEGIATGNHSLYGFFAFYGPSFIYGIKKDCEIIDLAPTVLYLMDVPIPNFMDGKALKDLIKK